MERMLAESPGLEATTSFAHLPPLRSVRTGGGQAPTCQRRVKARRAVGRQELRT